MPEQRDKAQGLYDAFLKPKDKKMPTNLSGFLGVAPVSIMDMFRGLKAPAPKPKFDIRNIPDAPMSKYVPPTEGPVAPVQQKASSAPVFSGGASAAPVASAPAPIATSAPTPEVPQQWLKEDGTFYTPDEIAGNIEAQMKSRLGNGDIGTYAASQFGSDSKSAEELATEARQLGNVKGDIASGETDPWKIAGKSGIAYTPEELKAIENAAAGIYDPALTTAYSKLEAREKADEEERKWERELEKLEKQHGYDLEKMQKDQDFQYALAGYKAALDAKYGKGSGTGGGSQSPYIDEQQFRSVNQANQLLAKAKANPGIFGRTAALPIFDFMRSDEFRNYAAELDTLKNSIAVGELQAMRADSSTGGALGQVSDQESARLSAALGALNMTQTPENVEKNLNQVISSINRYRAVKGQAPIPTSTGTSFISVGDDGVEYEIVEE